MRLSGLQKLTLLDFPGTVACTVFTGGCNFRCPFCHNASLVTQPQDDELSEDEFLDFLKKRQGILDGVVITGGEPTLHADLPELMKKIKALGYKIKIDTNGTNPQMLKQIAASGLADRIAMDIKSPPDGYAAATGLEKPDMDAVNDSKDFIMSCGIDYEFRTTVVKGIHTKESLIELSKWISGAEEYYLQQFKDSGNLICADGLQPFSEQEMNDFAEAVKPYVPSVKVRGI